MQFVLHFSEHNSFRDKDAFKSTQESDGWFENEYRIPFEARTLAEAKKIAHYKCDSSSGVFNVYDNNNNLVFTEE